MPGTLGRPKTSHSCRPQQCTAQRGSTQPCGPPLGEPGRCEPQQAITRRCGRPRCKSSGREHPQGGSGGGEAQPGQTWPRAISAEPTSTRRTSARRDHLERCAVGQREVSLPFDERRDAIKSLLYCAHHGVIWQGQVWPNAIVCGSMNGTGPGPGPGHPRLTGHAAVWIGHAAV